MSEHGKYEARPVEPSEHTFGRARRSASDQLAGGATRPPPQVFQQLPAPTGQPPFRLELATVPQAIFICHPAQCPLNVRSG